MLAIKITIFLIGTIIIFWASRTSLRDVNNHGFFRFFAWEMILIMFVLNISYWFIDPFSLRQIIAWSLLSISLIFIFQGVRLFHSKGKIDKERDDPSIWGIEKTTELVTSGLYRYIRHPFYSSLLFLTWGILFKRIIWYEVLLTIFTTIFLIITAKKEEVKNIKFFGDKYQEYMKNTKMFIPFVF